MPPAKYHWNARSFLLHGLRHANRSADHGACKNGNSQAQSVAHFSQNSLGPMRVNRCIHQRNFKPGFLKRRCETQKTERRAQGRSIVRRVEKDDFALPQHAASLANVSRRFASTAGLSASVLRFNRSLTQSSTGSL